MARLDEDLLEVLLAVANGTLGQRGAAKWVEQTALTVVLAANGYPGTPESGGKIDGIAEAEATGATVFQAGTRLQDGHIVA
ncbi:phosphoribosylglycinamide synthetase C domain-containing protein, partial [Klebsiella pneumoniae]|uniref:phosphoribosylglycinamide synthetase C domain-containing protein n=3 Tax=Pseudomonadota TaxID=1224 RepID=UPI003D083666